MRSCCCCPRCISKFWNVMLAFLYILKFTFLHHTKLIIALLIYSNFQLLFPSTATQFIRLSFASVHIRMLPPSRFNKLRSSNLVRVNQSLEVTLPTKVNHWAILLEFSQFFFFLIQSILIKNTGIDVFFGFFILFSWFAWTSLILIGLSKSLLHRCFHEVANGGPKEGQFGPYMIADISFISGSKSQ